MKTARELFVNKYNCEKAKPGICVPEQTEVA